MEILGFRMQIIWDSCQITYMFFEHQISVRTSHFHEINKAGAEPASWMLGLTDIPMALKITEKEGKMKVDVRKYRPGRWKGDT